MSKPSALGFALAMLLSGSAWPADDVRPPRYTLRESDARTGTNIKQSVVVGWGVPLDKTYAELTEAQRAQVKARYESMGPDDEPPFPARGLEPIYRAIAAAQQRLLVEDALSIVVDVNSLGEATAVSVLRPSSPAMTQFVAAVLLREHYKPAVCAGTPCRMQLPFRIDFNTRR